MNAHKHLIAFILTILALGAACADDIAGVNAMLNGIEKAHQTQDAALLGKQYSSSMLLIGDMPDPTQGAFAIGRDQCVQIMPKQLWEAAGLETRLITDREIAVRNDLAFVRMTISARFKDGRTNSAEQFVIAVQRDSRWQVCFGMPAMARGQAVITEVRPGSAAEKAQIKVGDVIAECDGDSVDPLLSGGDVKSALKASGASQVTLTLRRGSAEIPVKIAPDLPGATVEAVLVPVGPARLVPADEPHPVRDIVKKEIEILRTGEASGYKDIVHPTEFFSYRREPGKPVTLIASKNAQATFALQTEESRKALKASTIELESIGLIATENIAFANAAISAQDQSGSQLRILTRLQVFVRVSGEWRLAADLVERYRLKADEGTVYRSAEETQKAAESRQGKITGIGVQLTKVSDGIGIQRVFTGKPADKAGIRAGEVITSIDGKPTSDMTAEQAVAAITGQEGTQVTLTIRDASGSERTVTVTRETISVSGVEVRVLGGKVGHLDVNAFNMETAAAVRKALTTTLSAGNVRGIIIDLRENSGGVYSEVIKIAQMLIPGTPPKVLWTTRQQGKEPQAVRATSSALSALPLVVLIDDKTAGASELLARALQDNKRATLVGTKSAGAAVLKEVVANPDGSSRVVQVGDFLFPKTGKAGTDGVVPDVQAPAGATPNEVFTLGIKTLDKLVAQ